MIIFHSSRQEFLLSNETTSLKFNTSIYRSLLLYKWRSWFIINSQPTTNKCPQ